MDLPELDEMIIRELRLRDLSRCVRVSKKWHQVFVPFLWRDLSSLSYHKNYALASGQAFVKLILEDYHLEQQHQKLLEDAHGEQQTLSPTIPPPRRLATYCQWIQLLPHAEFLHSHVSALCSARRRLRARDPTAPAVPAEGDIMRQLYKQCPNIEVDHWVVHTKFIIEEDILKTVAEYVVPLIRHLHIGLTLYDHEIPAWRIKYLLSHCSSTLEELTLEARISYSEMETEYHQPEPRPWTKFKRLNLLKYLSDPCPEAFWDWLWSRCGAVEQLKVKRALSIRQSLAKGIVAHMPNLNKIRLKDCVSEDTEAILSTTHQGWKEVIIKHGNTYPLFTTHLLKHSVMLERLILYDVCGLTDKDRVQLLACCPNLREFSDIHPARSSDQSTPGFDAKFFIDQDLHTGSLKSWMCETSLKVLKISLNGIPRPDVLEERVDEDYPGHGRVMQSQVYDRLARFTNLETLWLGGNSGLKVFSCLEMSLESGLDRISGLKNLKELKVSHMKARIGEQETKWMIEQWPNLRVIYGIMEGRDKKAVKSLQQHHPKITLK
ncbi:MAG: hypothetical protein J3Q66DRAFT_443359 [Benniella sp.]|nr:MAG: hypothetical protein J3Q66DRAFT_443359 [Benniella sp.]